MGSRKGGDFRDLAGKSVKDKILKVKDMVSQNRPARIVVKTAIDVVAASNPILSGLVATYEVSKFLHKTATKVRDDYQKTGDKSKAFRTLAEESTKFAVSKTREQVISNYVDMSWKRIKNALGTSMDELTDRIVTKAAKNTLSEVLP
jgi:hypothetical protein